MQERVNKIGSGAVIGVHADQFTWLDLDNSEHSVRGDRHLHRRRRRSTG